MNNQFDILIIGGGVLGSFHAYHALNKGLKVALVEKDSMAQGATVRNFGQVVPSGMNLKWQKFGRESLAIYKSIQEKFDISVRKNGTIYIASNEDEVQLIEELHQINKNNNYDSLLMNKEECLKKYKGLKSSYCKAGLFFPQEVTIEPRIMIHKLRKFMTKNLNLTYIPDTTIINIEEVNGIVEATSSNGNTFKAAKVVICNGTEFKSLYPNTYKNSDLIVSKLQMLKTKPQKNYTLNGSVLTGLSIRRYEAFAECPSYKAIKIKEDKNSFEKKFGVHILFKQALDGSVIIGDSHEYASVANVDALGFDLNMDIDKFIIEEAKKIIDLPNYEIENRWLGFYSQCKNTDIFEVNITKNIHVVTGIGGKGMTGSAGYALENINKITN